MIVRAKHVADRLAAYLHHRLSQAELVDWAERVMMDGDFAARGSESTERIRDAVARLGLADVRAFGLTWEDCEQLLGSLGYAARVEITAGRHGPAPAVIREKPRRRYGR